MIFLSKISKNFLKRTRTKIGVGLTERTVQKPIDSDIFNSKAEAKIKAFEDAFRKLREDEQKVREIETSSLSKTLMVTIEGEGTYKFKLNPSESLLQLYSPISGGYSYSYNEVEDRFENTRDSHILDELVTRELLKVCQGFLPL